MLPLYEREGVGVIPWSPLTRGVAVRPHDQFDATTRSETDSYLNDMPYLQAGCEAINERVEERAEENGREEAVWCIGSEPRSGREFSSDTTGLIAVCAV